MFMSTQQSVSLDSLAKTAASVCSQNSETIADVASGADVAAILRGDIRSKLRVSQKGLPMLVVEGRLVPRWEIDGIGGREILLRIIDSASK